MRVLVHYTIQQSVYDSFSRVGSFAFTNNKRILHISDYFNKYNRTQEHLFFVVCYNNRKKNKLEYTACKICFNSNKYKFSSISDDMCHFICKELGLVDTNTYDKEVYYRIFTIEESSFKFINNNKKDDLNKIKLKFFSWDELLLSNDILFEEISTIIFTNENVLKVASTYKPRISYTSKQLKQKYVDALKSIGFISEDGINIGLNTLHGDIGEFLMHIMLGRFLCEQSSEKYIYPKLVFKSSPKMAVYGNDGTIYLKDKKEIYYLEAKFYSDINQAINKQ